MSAMAEPVAPFSARRRAAGRADGGAAFPVWRLALRDLAHDWRLSVIAVAGVTAALAPLVILVGLKLGVVEALRDDLRSDPATLELRMLGGGLLTFDEAWFEALAERPETGFALPMVRGTVASIIVRNRAARGTEPMELGLLPTAPGDPVLARAGVAAPEGEGIVLTEAAAARLGAGAGDTVEALVRRTDGSRLEAERLDLIVAGVLPPEASQRARGYVALDFLTAIEAYREWQGVDRYGWPGRPPVAASYADFRLYAADLDAVAPLVAHLRGLGVEVESAAEAIARVRRIDADLTLMVGALVGLTLSGVALTLALNQIAAVERRRTTIAVLRLVGYSGTRLMALPVVQAAALGLAGGIAALVVFALADPVLGALFGEVVAARGALTRLPLIYALAVPSGVVVIACAASLFAAREILRIVPSRELRHA